MTDRKFPWSRTFLIGFGFLGISLIWPIFNQYIPIFLQAGNKDFEAQLLAEGRKIPDVCGIWPATGFGPIHNDLGQPDQHICSTVGGRQKRPYLEPLWAAQGLDTAGGADRCAGVCFHSRGTIGDRNNGIYLDH